MRTFQIIPFPGDQGFALQNTETKQVSSVIPIRQRGLTGAKFADGTAVLVNIEAYGSAVVVSLAEEEDFFPCPRCGGNHGDSKEAAILIEGSTLSVAEVVRDEGIFGRRPLSLMEILTGPSSFDSLRGNTRRPSRPRDQSPPDRRSPFHAVDEMIANFFNSNEDESVESSLKDDDSEGKPVGEAEAATEIEASVSGEATDSSEEQGISLFVETAETSGLEAQTDEFDGKDDDDFGDDDDDFDSDNFGDDDDDFDNDDDDHDHDDTDLEAEGPAEIEASVSGEVTDSPVKDEGNSLEVNTSTDETAVPAGSATLP